MVTTMMKAMKLVVGLGNSGKKYVGTRHNTGFLVVDRLRFRISQEPEKLGKGEGRFSASDPKLRFRKRLESEVLRVGNLVLAKPQTFMNRSGEAVGKLVGFYKISPKELYVVHDDLDIELGSYKIGFGKGPRQHNGLRSIYEYLGTREFWHVRVGIESRKQETGNRNKRIVGEVYVLQKFTRKEEKVINEVIDRVIEELLDRLAGC